LYCIMLTFYHLAPYSESS